MDGGGKIQATARKSRRWKKTALAAVFVAMFFLGYNASTAVFQTCNAQLTGPYLTTPPPVMGSGTCSIACCLGGCFWECVNPGQTATIVSSLITSLRTSLINATRRMEQDSPGNPSITTLVTDATQMALYEIDWLEEKMIRGWETFWYYNLMPGLQAMAQQLNADTAMQSLLLHGAADAAGMMEVDLALEKHGIDDLNALGANQKVCIAATGAAGIGRADNFAHAMRLAWEVEAQAPGLNTQGTIGATGKSVNEGQRYRDYEENFCDPASNSGTPACAAPDPAFFNADVQPTKYLYGRLTADVNMDPRMAKAVEAILNNMTGTSSAPAILIGAQEMDGGQIAFINRRSYLARYAAVRAAPQLVAGWRMPGSRLRDWVRDLRLASGTPITEISENPSYKEVLHAVSIDRFNSGLYAAEMMTDESKVEMEKLTLDVFTLMQLHDYYELLERTALTLAVQVSVMLGEQNLPVPNREAPN